MLREQLGERIKALRTKKGWSLREMARRMDGMSFQAIARWEAGEINLPYDRVQQLADLFDVAPQSFFLCPPEVGTEKEPIHV